MRTRHYFLIGLIAALIGGLTWANQQAEAQTAATCQAFGDASIAQQASTEIVIFCNEQAVIYFGVCDSGNQGDDYFEMVFNGTRVSNNYFTKEREKVIVLSGLGETGFNRIALNSLNAGSAPPATFAYATSTDFTQVRNFLFELCGTDYTGIGIVCTRIMPIYIKGAAPTSGTLRVMGRFGELNRLEGITFTQYRVSQGAIVNNIFSDVRGPTYIRLWWQPSGSSDWYLLPSQYWRGGGTVASEYGIECDHSMGVPTYDSDWSKVIKDSDVPLLDINDDGKIVIIPTLTVWAQQTATAEAIGSPTPQVTPTRPLIITVPPTAP